MKFLKQTLYMVMVLFFSTSFGDIAHMHPNELMPLVHGEFYGTCLWIWDLCYEQHPYTLGSCVAVVAVFAFYELSSGSGPVGVNRFANTSGPKGYWCVIGFTPSTRPIYNYGYGESLSFSGIVF